MYFEMTQIEKFGHFFFDSGLGELVLEILIVL